MAKELEVTIDKTVTVTMDGAYADKLEFALGRALDATANINPAHRALLVNSGVTDTLVALLAALKMEQGRL